MPELPEVETIVRRLRREVPGDVIRTVQVFRPSITHPDLKQAEGQRIESIERRGKVIAIHLSGEQAIRVHLRMTGDLEVIPDARLHSTRVRILFKLKSGRGLVYQDPRALGKVHLFNEERLQELLDDLGVEPLSRRFTADLLIEMAARSKKPAKLFLMDQGHIAGIGNMYAAEALFRARIAPTRPMNRVSKEKLRMLREAIITVLNEAIRHAAAQYRKPGFIEDMEFAVYGRRGEPCPRCGKKIRRITQGARSTYYCPGCQR